MAALAGCKIEGANRLGKHLWLDLPGSPSLMFHFGALAGNPDIVRVCMRRDGPLIPFFQGSPELSHCPT